MVTNDEKCNYYTVNGGHCQLARFNYNSGSYYKGEFNDLTEYQLKKSINLGSMMQSLLGSSNRNCPGRGFHTLTYNGQSVSLKYFKRLDFFVNKCYLWYFNPATLWPTFFNDPKVK